MKSENACRISGKPLTDPVSVETGVGPICRVSEKLRQVDGRQKDLFGNERSTYTWEEAGDIICVVDHDIGRTVTNDAERVVEDLVECLGSLSGKRVIYRDTRGVWDEIAVRGNRFAGFLPINEKDRSAALRKIFRGHVQAAAQPVSLAEFLGGALPNEVAQVTTDMRGNITSARLL